MLEDPHIGAFSLNAYYEEDPETKKVIRASYSDVGQTGENKVFNIMDLSGFRKEV